MSRERWMALLFAIGSTCFLIGPFPGYADLVGDSADAVTFFVGSIFFTAGGDQVRGNFVFDVTFERRFFDTERAFERFGHDLPFFST